MEPLSVFDSHVETISDTTSQLFQRHSSILGLSMLRDALGRDWLALETGGDATLALGRTMLDRAHQVSSERRQTLLQRFQEFQTARLTEIGANLFEAEADFLQDGETLGSTVRRFLDHFNDARDRHDALTRDDFDRDLALSYCIHALKAQSFARFNIDYFEADQPTAEVAAVNVTEACAAFKDQLRLAQLKVYNALLEGRRGPSLRASLRAICLDLETDIPAFFKALAPAVRAYIASRAAGVVGQTDTLGRALISANDHWREAVCFYTAAHVLRFELLTFKRVGAMRKLIDQPGGLAFDAVPPDGVNATIGGVADVADGALVEIWGVVRGLDVDRLGDDTIVSRFRLETVTGNASVACAVRFAQLPRMGVAEGAYMRLNGTKEDAVTILDDVQGVRVQQLSHVALAAKSWRYAAMRLSEPYFPRWRHKLNIGFTPMAHLPPADWQGGPVTGSGEFIYSPFLR